MFLRHGHASEDSFGVDLLRPLSEKGRQECWAVKLPRTPQYVLASPSLRTMQTAELVGKITPIIMPILYGPILLPEMDEMYKKHGLHVRGYLSDPNIKRTRDICKKIADGIIPKSMNTLMVGHGTILNFIAYEICQDERLFDIDLETAKGFEIGEQGLIQLI